ncbi:MAG: hypothetical protein HY297_02175 [Thaumarchaeota archaeon]|nr:hypothetical protein [Nitrososphaerota archaeon]
MYHRGQGKELLMTLVQSEASSVNARTVQLVKLLSEVGPDVPEISRRLGQFKESVRYRYKEKIVAKGIAVQAAVDHERLGLRRIVMVVEFNEAYKNYAQAIFAAMNEVSYVVGFAKALVGGQYIVGASVPAGLVEEVKGFFLSLRDRGMFSSVEVFEFDWFRSVPMRAEFYDFDTGRWDFEWQGPASQDFQGAGYAPSAPAKFDYVDLLIIKELQMDANKSLKEISDKLGINYKKLAWHHATHVSARKLLRGYSVNWMGTRYDYAIEKALHRKHRYFALAMIVSNVTEYETMALRQRVDRLPFLWSEAVGRNYYAEFAFPVDYVVEGLQYVGDAAATVRERMSLFTIDQTDAGSFTIPYALYDAPRKRWAFERNELAKRFDELIVQIKIGAH